MIEALLLLLAAGAFLEAAGLLGAAAPPLDEVLRPPLLALAPLLTEADDAMEAALRFLDEVGLISSVGGGWTTWLFVRRVDSSMPGRWWFLLVEDEESAMAACGWCVLRGSE